MDKDRTDRQLRLELKKKRAAGQTWQAIADECEVVNGKGKPDRALAHRIAHGYIPHKPETRRRLRLPIMEPVPVCQIHGIVHKQRCPSLTPVKNPRAPRWGWLWDVPERELREMLENRREF